MRRSTLASLCAFAFALPAIAAEPHPAAKLEACAKKGNIGDATVVDKAWSLPRLTLEKISALLAKEQSLCTVPDDCGDLERCLRAADSFYEKLGLRAKSPGDDDWKTLKADAAKALDLYANATVRKSPSFEDPQDHASADFYLRTGGAQFNPNGAQTEALRRSLVELTGRRRVYQAELVHEALIAAEGNLPLAMGSLAQIFHDQRNSLISRVEGMKDDSGKNYYRYAGAFIGLQNAPVRLLGEIGSYANIGGNPIVYAAAEVIGFWGKAITTGSLPQGIDTIETVSSRGKVGPKSRQLQMGIEAMLELTGQDKKTARGFEGGVGKGIRRQPATIRKALDSQNAHRAIERAANGSGF